eukprot:jgi/Psemu1/37590/gm1.37590_g
MTVQKRLKDEDKNTLTSPLLVKSSFTDRRARYQSDTRSSNSYSNNNSNSNSKSVGTKSSTPRTVCLIFFASFLLSLNTIFLTRITTNSSEANSMGPPASKFWDGTQPMAKVVKEEEEEEDDDADQHRYHFLHIENNERNAEAEAEAKADDHSEDEEITDADQSIENHERDADTDVDVDTDTDTDGEANNYSEDNEIAGADQSTTIMLHTEVRPPEENSQPASSEAGSETKTTAAPTEISKNVKNVHVVVSHCDASIQWIWKKYLKDIPKHDYHIKSVTILTKCGHEIPAQDLPATLPEPMPIIQVVTLPNVGRCDHSYAYWITQVLHGGDTGGILETQSTERKLVRKLVRKREHGTKDGLVYVHFPNDVPFRRISADIHPDEIVLFLKDNNNAYRKKMENTIEVVDMFRAIAPTRPSNDDKSFRLASMPPEVPTANSHGLACRSFPSKKLRFATPNQYLVTEWAHRSVLWTFKLNQYARRGKKEDPKIEANPVQESKLDFVSKYRPMGKWITYLASQGGDASASGGTAKGVATKTSRKLRGKENAQGTNGTKNTAKPSVFSKDYWEHGISETTAKHMYYYNATSGGLKDLVDAPNPKVKKAKENYKVTPQYKARDVIPTCFGGVFATQWGQISSEDAPITPHGWSVITNELSRADNIEEGHYMERWWADILSWSTYTSSQQQAWAREQEALLSRSPTLTEGTPEETSLETSYSSATEDLHLSSLSEDQQAKLLGHKLMHWSYPDSYTGIIVLNPNTFGNHN